MAGGETPARREQLLKAQQVLASKGFDVGVELVAGEPEQALPSLVKAQGSALLVMGAYGHSRIRQLIVGSTTTMLLRLSEVPVLILR
jgi:nucleotide-binding universal stress UspA family protein